MCPLVVVRWVFYMHATVSEACEMQNNRWLTYFFYLYLCRAQEWSLPFLWEGPAWNNPWPGYKHKVQQWTHAPSRGPGESASTGLPCWNRIYLLRRHHKFPNRTTKDWWKQPGNYSQRWLLFYFLRTGTNSLLRRCQNNIPLRISRKILLIHKGSLRNFCTDVKGWKLKVWLWQKANL